jgi:hypothetical protein
MWHQVKTAAFYFALAFIALVLAIAGYALLRMPGGMLSAFLVGLCAVVSVWWYVEFRRAPRLERERQMATADAARQELPLITFNDGSTSRFEPTDVIRAGLDIVIAIDIERKLVRMITHAALPDEGVDWIYEVPDNMDLDVADYPRRFRKRKKVPSLLFSSEESDGTHVVALPLAADSVATARRLVAQLRARRRIP